MANKIAPYNNPVMIGLIIQFLRMDACNEKYGNSTFDYYRRYLKWIIENSTSDQLRETLNFPQFSKTISIAKAAYHESIRRYYGEK